MLDTFDLHNIADTPKTSWDVRDELDASIAAFDTVVLKAAEHADQLGCDMSAVDFTEARDVLVAARDEIEAAMRLRAE